MEGGAVIMTVKKFNPLSDGTEGFSMKLPADLEPIIDAVEEPPLPSGPEGYGANSAHGEPEQPAIESKSWWRDPASIPPRKSFFGTHYIRRAVGATIGAGGRAKTTLGCSEAVSMAIGRDLMTGKRLPDGPLRVGMLNGEEDQDELDRRVAAVCQHYGITEADLGGRLFVQSVRDRPMRIATMVRNAPTLNDNAVKQITAFMTDNRIDVLMVDPFVSFHSVPENDNGAMDLVIKEGFGAIANKTNAAVEVFHHPGKPKPGQAETTVEDGRGASAILWAVRSARVLNFMTPDEASKLGISDDERRLHIRIANGKANMGPLGKAEWMRLKVENLPNGDQVAVTSRWTPPDPLQNVTTAHMELARKLVATGEHRADSRSPKWVGYALASQLNIAVSYNGDNAPKDIAKLNAIIKKWIKNKVFEVDRRKDSNGAERDFIIPGAFKPEPQTTTSTVYADDEFTMQ